MSISFCLPYPDAVSDFIICKAVCACTEMWWICVVYLHFGSKLTPKTFGCIIMGSTVLFILRFTLLLYSAGLFFFWQKLYVVWFDASHGCTRDCLCRCDGDVICVGHDLNRCYGWWKVSSVNIK